MAVPGCAHPLVAPVEWAELARPGTPLHWAVLNVADGPGGRLDRHCLAAAVRLRDTGVPLLGHLDLRDGSRPFGELVGEARRYLDWYGVEGFYLDRPPADAAGLPETRRVLTTLRALGEDGRGGVRLVLAHGTHPHPGYAEIADQVVTFRGGWPEYRWSQVAEWTADFPPDRFCHLVHGVPRPHLDEALRVARWQGAGTVYFTDRDRRDGFDPWEALPGYWDEIVSKLGPGVSE
ncbi:spherulation-specific family 4 protein [Streptomyces sp. 549]|uniref:spherulation-specific family 4 protein n=1 Tax=Streptomyces sp. 549 TaxID=3049076 RepID=UPI0024C239D0|nr:spherulation-specific family 4 protein [Streptomyces sp. 549]MDK1476291.1 spherulation-specific family 4 protein [Streptomyces sp. 549]